MRSAFVLPIVFSALPLIACGGATTAGPSPDGGAGEDARSAVTTDAGASTADTGTSTLDAGTLLLQAFGGASGEVAAQVPLLEPGVGQEQTCAAPVDAGACQLTSCQLGGIGSPGGGYGDFGPMTATVGATTVALTYNGIGYPTVYFPPSVTLGEGGTMTFHGGNGADVPTFDVSATIPGLAVITSPAPTADGGAPIIDTSQDLSVTWVPISIGQILFGLDGGSSSIDGVAVSVACTFDGASGSGVVPQTLLASLKQMNGTNPTYADLGSELEATTVVDGLTIVTQSAQNAPTTGRAFNVTLQ